MTQERISIVQRAEIVEMFASARAYMQDTLRFFAEGMATNPERAHGLPYATQIIATHLQTLGIAAEEYDSDGNARQLHDRYQSKSFETIYKQSVVAHQHDSTIPRFTDDNLARYVYLQNFYEPPFKNASYVAILPQQRRTRAARAILVNTDIPEQQPLVNPYQLAINSVFNDLMYSDAWIKVLQHIEYISHGLLQNHQHEEYLRNVGFYLRLWLLSVAQDVAATVDTAFLAEWNRPVVVDGVVERLQGDELWLAALVRLVVEATG